MPANLYLLSGSSSSIDPILINKMLGLRRRATSNIISTQQCLRMMSNNSKLIDEHIINEQQEELVSNYETALRIDYSKEETIKDHLTHRYFNSNSKKKKRYYLQEKLNLNDNNDLQIRKRLSLEFKKSITGQKQHKKRSSRTPHLFKRQEQTRTPYLSTRYQKTLTPIRPTFRTCTPSFSSRSAYYSSQIDDIIEQAHQVSTRSSGLKRNLLTATDKKKLLDQTDQIQKKQIIDKIIEKDVDDYLKFAFHIGSNPQDKKRHFEDAKIKELSNFDKYNMSFVNYMKIKTHSNIQKSIYDQKVRHKETYVEKFQNFILAEFKFSEEARRRLEKVFKGIELEYKRPAKNRQISERMPI